MKIKVSEATPLQLNWLVATCEGYTDLRRNPHRFNDDLIMTPPRAAHGPVWFVDLAYSTDWSQAGPIIEREKIQTVWRILDADGAGYWDASNLFADKYHYRGPTPLVAAMRCYVACKLGDVVEIPEELTS